VFNVVAALTNYNSAVFDFLHVYISYYVSSLCLCVAHMAHIRICHFQLSWSSWSTNDKLGTLQLVVHWLASCCFLCSFFYYLLCAQTNIVSLIGHFTFCWHVEATSIFSFSG